MHHFRVEAKVSGIFNTRSGDSACLAAAIMGASSLGRSMGCAVCLLVVGVVLFCLGIWMTTVYVSFTPVYTELTCVLNDPEVTSFSIGTFELGVAVTSTCSNPNPYDLIVSSTKVGQVYMGKANAMSEVGTVTDIPEKKLPADGKGNITAYLSIAPSGGIFGSVFDIIMSSEIPIWLENNLEVKVDAKILFGSFKTTRPFEKKCVMNWKVELPATSKLGPMSCADTFAELIPEPVGSSAANTLTFPADSMAGEEIDEATTQKNVACGLGMALGYGLGVAFLVFGVVVLCRARGSKTATDASDTQPAEALT